MPEIQSPQPAPAQPLELKDLVGAHRLDAVDMRQAAVTDWSGNEVMANAIAFRLDGIAYVAMEDENDGYRSAMREIAITTEPMKNVFAPLAVVGRHRTKGEYRGTDDVLELIDVTNGQIVLEVGTENVDDYYPGFVSSFHPERMAHNVQAPEGAPLPPLPEPHWPRGYQGAVPSGGYTSDQMHAYARAALAAPAPQAAVATVEDNSQDWAGMDGTTAWHLIERHADNWADIGKMMGEWLAANQAAPSPAEGDADPWQLLSNIDTWACMLPTFEVVHEGGPDAAAENVILAIKKATAALDVQPKGTAPVLQDLHDPRKVADMLSMMAFDADEVTRAALHAAAGHLRAAQAPAPVAGKVADLLRECELFLRVLGLDSEPAAKLAADCRAALAVQAPAVQDGADRLRKFLYAAAGEGFELDGVDAGELFMELFPDFFSFEISKPPVQGSGQ